MEKQTESDGNWGLTRMCRVSSLTIERERDYVGATKWIHASIS